MSAIAAQKSHTSGTSSGGGTKRARHGQGSKKMKAQKIDDGSARFRLEPFATGPALPDNYQRKNSFELPYYRGLQLPDHLKWVTITGRSSAEVLEQEVAALELELTRLKEAKMWNKELRKLGGLPIGILSKPCPCCRKWERKRHDCSHKYCEKPCRKYEEMKEREEKRLAKDAEKRAMMAELHRKKMEEEREKERIAEREKAEKAARKEQIAKAKAEAREKKKAEAAAAKAEKIAASNAHKAKVAKAKEEKEAESAKQKKEKKEKEKSKNDEEVKICSCCGMATKRHRCDHTLCKKPCKKEVMQNRRLAKTDPTYVFNQAIEDAYSPKKGRPAKNKNPLEEDKDQTKERKSTPQEKKSTDGGNPQATDSEKKSSSSPSSEKKKKKRGPKPGTTYMKSKAKKQESTLTPEGTYLVQAVPERPKPKEPVTESSSKVDANSEIEVRIEDGGQEGEKMMVDEKVASEKRDIPKKDEKRLEESKHSDEDAEMGGTDETLASEDVSVIVTNEESEDICQSLAASSEGKDEKKAEDSGRTA